ncbi:MAG TPA: TetR/AcrR family transcriptional regulator C-terminal domain-containing protein [Trebonia sp.]|nr:TetR/AcrR family transcriptional regulator C-terminal domain-containing protein [Trebonia sp.]
MDEEGDEVFVPLRRFYASGPAGRRERDRRTADRVERRREHGGRPAPRARGLSRPDIVSAAVAVADAEGTGAVSIRRIARDLGAGPMSLYWHVSSIEELHQLMVERVQAEIEAPEPSGDWRADLRGYAHASRAALLRHPWAADFLGIGPPSGPNDARNAERLIAVLDGVGLDLPATMWALLAVATYVTGAALREIQEARWQRAAAETAAGMTVDEVNAQLAEFNRRIRESGRYPHITRLLDAGLDPDSPESRDERFEFGLGCVLDGIAARIRTTSGGPPHAS